MVLNITTGERAVNNYGNLLIAHPARVNVVIKWFFSVADPIVHFKAVFLDFLTVHLIPLRPAVTVIRRRSKKRKKLSDSHQ